MTDQRPNILCFVTDQQRADHLGCYGNAHVNTPNIDRLATQGILFTQSFVANPLCMPNRATLFTGMYPKVHGVRENGIGLHPSMPVLPEILRQAGYQTGLFGKLHLSPFSIERHTPPDEWEVYETPEYWAENDTMPVPLCGFESTYYVGGHGPYTFGEYRHDIGDDLHKLLAIESALEPPTGARESWKSSIPEAAHYNTRIADKAVEFVHNRDTERPFFIWCSFPDPHHPYMPPTPYCYQYDPDEIPFQPARREGELDDLPPYFRDAYEGKIRLGGLRGGAQITSEEYREIIAHTYGMISMVDTCIGRVVDALEEQGLLDNTVIVFMSDHGDLMGDHWLINKGPFPFTGLVRVPAVWRVPDAPAAGSPQDAMISAVDFAPTVLDICGVDIPPAVQGQSYRELLAGNVTGHREAIYLEYDSTYLQDRLRSLRTGAWAITYFASADYGLLYDLHNDPNELHNLWDVHQYRSIKESLLIELLGHAVRSDSWQPSRKAHA